MRIVIGIMWTVSALALLLRQASFSESWTCFILHNKKRSDDDASHYTGVGIERYPGPRVNCTRKLSSPDHGTLVASMQHV
jgi:hypothetical protein